MTVCARCFALGRDHVPATTLVGSNTLCGFHADDADDYPVTADDFEASA